MEFKINDAFIAFVRKLLSPLREKADIKSSLVYTSRKGNSPYCTLNILLVVGDEAVIVLPDKQTIREFQETTGTRLGQHVKQILVGAGLSFGQDSTRVHIKPKLLAKLAISADCDGMWHCPKCGQGDGIEIISDTDYQPAIRKAFQQHKEISPDCQTTIKIYRAVDGEMIELTNLSLLTGAAT